MRDSPLNRLNARRGSQLPWSKLDEQKVAEINRILARREQLKEELKRMTNGAIARQYGVHIRSIDRIATGETWSHVPQEGAA